MPSVADLVIQSSTSTGTGNFTLASLASGSPPYFYRNFSDVFGTGAGNTFYYCIRNQSAAEFEVGVGYMSSATVMVRQSVLKSSNANALVNFSAGVKDVICDMPADYQQIKPINHGGTGASTADNAIINIVDAATPLSPGDLALVYFPVVDTDGGNTGGKINVDQILSGLAFGLGPWKQITTNGSSVIAARALFTDPATLTFAGAA